MTRVDFYVLGDDCPKGRLVFVCRLAEKALASNKQVFIYSDDHDMLDRLDEALWSFRTDSFVPHALVTQQDAMSSPAQAMQPVLLSSHSPDTARPVLINLASAVPPFFSRFDRTLEVVNQSTNIREHGRVRYRFYQERGYPLQHHRI